MNRIVEAGQILSGRYQLTEPRPDQLDHEGAEFWSAEDTLLGKPVRILVLDPRSPVKQSTLDAARRSALVDDTHLVRVLSVSDSPEVAFVTLEVPRGHQLSEFLKKPLSGEQAWSILGTLSQTLDTAKMRGLRHDQITPQSIWVSSNGSILLDGVGISAALAGNSASESPNPEADRIEARKLLGFGAGLVTGTFPIGIDGIDLSIEDALKTPDLPEPLRAAFSREFEGEGLPNPHAIARTLGTWPALDLSVPQTSNSAPAVPAPPAVSSPEPAQPAMPRRKSAFGADRFFSSNREKAEPPVEKFPKITAPLGGDAAGIVTERAPEPPATPNQTVQTDHVDEPMDDNWGPGPAPVAQWGGPKPESTGATAVFAKIVDPDDSDGPHDDHYAKAASVGFAAGLASEREAGQLIEDESAAEQLVDHTAQPDHAQQVPDVAQPDPAPQVPDPVEPTPAENAVSAQDTSRFAPPDEQKPTADDPTPTADIPALTSSEPTTSFAPTHTAAEPIVVAEAVSAPEDEPISAPAASTPVPVESTPETAPGFEEVLPSNSETQVFAPPSQAQAQPESLPHSAEAMAFASTDLSAEAPAPAPTRPPASTHLPAAPAQSAAAQPPNRPPASTYPHPENQEPQRRYNPSKVFTLGTVILVAIAFIWAAATLFKPTSDPATTKPVATATATAGATAEAKPAQTTAPAQDYPAPAISTVTLLNPEASALDASNVDEQDSPSTIGNTYDGNPATVWRSWWYSAPTYVGKSGLGLEIKLAEKTEVSSVTLAVSGTGGNVQWRDTTSDQPKAGSVLAEGAMSAETTLSVDEPQVTDSIVLWFNELPTDEEGNYRISISEISVK